MDPLISIGTIAPDFTLPDLKGFMHPLKELQGRIVVLYFWSAECDWCERVDVEVLPYLTGWKDRVSVLWIASNANEPRNLIEEVVAKRQLPVVLVDASGELAGQYGAQTTQHFFVADFEGKLAYQGAWDDITFRKRVASQLYLPLAVEALLGGQKPAVAETPPYGCTLVRFTE